MRIHQAFFGDKNGSHNIIGASLENKLVIGYLKLNTDIPASIAITASYLSGTPVENYYVFTRTMDDPTSERPGMGFSHCLIIAMEDIGALNNLHELTKLFVDEPQKNVGQILELELSPGQPIYYPLSPTSADLLGKLTFNTTTVVYPGYENFEDDIAKLWSTLSAEQRLKFSFTISGSPNEIVNEQISLIHTPENFEARWSKFPIVSAGENEYSTAEDIRLLTHPLDAESIALRAFIKENAINFEYLHQYPAITKLFKLSNKAIAEPNAILLKRVIVAINELIPKPQVGTEFKNRILSLFIKQISLNDSKDILLLRNMVFTAFEDGQKKISALTDLWSKTYILPNNVNFFPDGIKVMEEAYLPANPEWWKKKINDQFDHICKTLDAASAHFIWQIWTAAPTIIQHTKLRPADEQLIFAQITKSDKPVFYQELSKFSTKKEWYYMFAESVSNELPAHQAIQAQLKIDKSIELEKHLDVIRNNVRDDVFFKECIAIDNETLHQMGGKLLVSHPEYFQVVDIQNIGWQKVWYESFQVSGKITPNGKPADKEFLGIIAQVVAKMNYSKPLLNIIAQDTGNVYSCEQRKLIWPLLETDTRNIILEKTCIHILSNFNASEWPVFESEIKNTFLNDTFVNEKIIKSITLGINEKIKISGTINKLHDKELIEIIKSSNNLVNELEAATLIETINTHKFGETLDYCYFNRNRYASFNQIVNGCKQMLSAWERLWLSSSSIPIRLHDIYKEVDRQNLSYVFQILRNLGFNDQTINRIQDEYVAGVKGIELMDLCNRLKAYIQSKS